MSVSLVVAVAALTGGAAVASADGATPAGNNGTIKIDELVMDGGLGNDPHVPCGFSVSFFGYDTGTQDATIAITPWAPTDGGQPFTTATSWTTAERTGGNQLDANVPIGGAQLAAAFAGIEPAAQGIHVRVEVHVTGAQGADVKYKMLWVEPCQVTGTTTPPPADEAAVVTTVENGASHDDATPAAVGAAATVPQAQVLGESVVKAAEVNAIPAAGPAVARAVAATTTG